MRGDRRLSEMLARWHDWRSHYSTQRGFAHVVAFGHGDHDDEHELMLQVDELVERLPRRLQLALQHEARALALGVEVFHNPHLPTDHRRLNAQVQDARRELTAKLQRLGLL